MTRIKVCDLKINDLIIGTCTSDGKGIYGRFITPLIIDSIFMNVKLMNCFPSDNTIRFNVNGKTNNKFPELGCVSLNANAYVFVAAIS